MIVDLTETDRWPRQFDITIEPKDIDLQTANARLIGPVKAKVAVEKHEAWFDIKGLIEGRAEIDCSRCLEPVERSLSIPFNVRFTGADNPADPHEREVDSSDLDMSEIEGGRLDLKEVIREQILLDLPEQIFCKEDCKGLCPKCGKNRNLIDCKCARDEVDPRWAALKNLK